MELQVHKQDGTEAGRTVALDEEIFGIRPNDHVVWLDVRRIQAHARQGTHKAKERGEVAGSTRKLYRQKGTGNARAGSAKSPIRKTGGRTFGPRPRTYSLKLNKKTKQLARRSALAYKVQEEALRVIEDFAMDVPSTKQFLQMLTAMDLTGKKVLLLTADHQPAFVNSCRNVPKVSVLEARNASTLDLLGANIVLLQEGALDALKKTLN